MTIEPLQQEIYHYYYFYYYLKFTLQTAQPQAHSQITHKTTPAPSMTYTITWLLHQLMDSFIPALFFENTSSGRKVLLYLQELRAAGVPSFVSDRVSMYVSPALYQIACPCMCP